MKDNIDSCNSAENQHMRAHQSDMETTVGDNLVNFLRGLSNCWRFYCASTLLSFLVQGSCVIFKAL